MTYTRREFLETATATAALSAVACSSDPAATVANVGDDPLGVRRDFHVIERMTYLDSAYITPSPLQAVTAAQAFLEAKARDPVSLGGMLEATNDVRGSFARLVRAEEAEIGLLFATSEGENIVAAALDLGPGDNVVIDDLHYETTYVLYRHLAETRGIELRIVRSEAGEASPEAFAQLVDEHTRLISVAWISHQNGYRHDLRALARLAHDHGAYLYADAIQGVGMLDLDVRSTDIDFFTAGTYKWLLGGYGVAPFYVKASLLDTVRLDRMGSLHIAEELDDFEFTLPTDARKYGYATLGFGAVYQLRAALEYLERVGVANIERHTVALARRLRTGLVDQGYPVWTPERNGSAIVTLDHGHDIGQVRTSLESANVKVSLKQDGAQIRVGIALFNNDADVDRLLEVTEKWA